MGNASLMPASGTRILLVVDGNLSSLMVDASNQNTVGANLVALHLKGTVAASLRLTNKLNELVVSDLRHVFFSLSESTLPELVGEVKGLFVAVPMNFNIETAILGFSDMGFARLPKLFGIIPVTKDCQNFPILIGIDSQNNVCVIVVAHRSGVPSF